MEILRYVYTSQHSNTVPVLLFINHPSPRAVFCQKALKTMRLSMLWHLPYHFQAARLDWHYEYLSYQCCFSFFFKSLGATRPMVYIVTKNTSRNWPIGLKHGPDLFLCYCALTDLVVPRFARLRFARRKLTRVHRHSRLGHRISQIAFSSPVLS